MSPSQIDEIIKLDKLCFERPIGRTKENIRALLDISDGGSFVGVLNGKIIAYLFTHRYGNVGTIGPLGVHTDYRGNGYARQLIQKSIGYLSKCGCGKIGLEVLPEKGENIGLYLKLGFQFVQPSLILKIKSDKSFFSENCVNAQQITDELLADFLERFESKHNHYSLRRELRWVLENHPDDIIFYKHEQDIRGFMCYTADLYKFIFGYICDDCELGQVIYELYNALCSRFEQEDLKIRVNAKYNRIVELLGREIMIEKAVTRMELYLDKDNLAVINDIVFRSWIG